jgi:uncharacterized protein (TIGR03437 family)
LALATPTQVSNSIRNVQVFFNDIPAPLLCVSSTQVNAIVPYEVTGSTVSVSVIYNGTPVLGGTYILQPSTPALFTQSCAAASPAARGSVVQLFATGAGATVPPNITGAVATDASVTPVLPVGVTIGGVPAMLTYVGNAPGEVKGLLQVNGQVPLIVVPGPAVPVILTVGAAQSPLTAVLAVQ